MRPLGWALSQYQISSLTTVTDAKIEVRMPIVSVTAKPRIGPEPSQNMMSGASQCRELAVGDRDEGALESGVDTGDRRFAARNSSRMRS